MTFGGRPGRGHLLTFPLLFRWSGCSSPPQTQSPPCPKTRALCPAIDSTPTAPILWRLTWPCPPPSLREPKSSVGFPIGLWKRLCPSACWWKSHKPVCSPPLLLQQLGVKRLFSNFWRTFRGPDSIFYVLKLSMLKKIIELCV